MDRYGEWIVLFLSPQHTLETLSLDITGSTSVLGFVEGGVGLGM